MILRHDDTVRWPIRHPVGTLVGPALVLAVGLAGCGSPTPSATSNSSVQGNPSCSLLSTSQVGHLMDGHVAISTHASDCYYLLKPGTFLSISAGPANAAPSLASLIDRYSHFPGNSVFQVAAHTALWVAYPANALGGGRLAAVAHGDLIYVRVTQGGPNPMSTAVQAMTDIINAQSSGF